jgi:hypothetical protein
MIKRNYPLRAVLALSGIAIIFLGLNVGLGGIQTLGWQGNAEFITVTDPAIFAIRDSHIRFIGGVWLAVGLLMLAGAFALQRLRPVLVALTAMIFAGGITRLLGGDLSLLTSAAIAPSLALELIAFPLLGLWVMRGEQLQSDQKRAPVGSA